MGLFDRKKTSDGEDQSKAEMDAMFERFGSMVDERMKPVVEKVSALSTDWEAVKAEATKSPVVDTRPRDENGNVRDLTPEERQRDMNIALAKQNIATSARLTERDVLDALPKDYADLKPQIAEMFRSTPIERKAQPDYAEYCQNCADLAIAREARKGGVRRNSDTKEFFLEDKSAGSSASDSILNDPSLVWHYDSPNGPQTMSAKEQLRKLHIDPKDFEDYAKRGRV
jgi:hypothetical protein